MRLAILGTRGIPAEYGGFETFAEELACRLVKKGVMVTVFCEADGAERRSEFRGVHLKYCRAPSCGPLTTIVFDLLSLWESRDGYDVVYMLGYGSAIFCLIPKLWGTQVWINPDGVEWRRQKWSWLAKLWLRGMESVAVRLADLVVADARAIRDSLESRHGPLRACSVIPYGADIVATAPASLLKKWKLSAGQYDLVVCRLEPENHVAEIIMGYQQSQEDRCLVVVGDHDTVCGKELRALADKHVKFIGTVFDSDRLQALRFHARIYFHGHSVGGTNPSLLEAMAVGNVTVAHENVFNREVLGGNGFYFRTHEDICRIVRLLRTMPPSELATTGSRNRLRVEEAYSWDHVAEQYYRLLGLLDSPNQAGGSSVR